MHDYGFLLESYFIFIFIFVTELEIGTYTRLQATCIYLEAKSLSLFTILDL